MRRTALMLLLAGLVAAPAVAQTPTVDELLTKNVEARGGAEKLRAVNTRKVTGKVAAQGMEMTMQVYSKRPNLMLQEMQLGDRRLVTAFDGQKAWGVNPMMGGDTPQELQGLQAELLRDQAAFDGPLALARQRGDKVEVAGKEEVDGASAWKLVVTHEGRQTMVYLDEKTGLERKVSSSISEGGMQLLIESLISNYQATDGIKVPRTVRTLVGGQGQATVTIDSVEFNVPLDDAKFKMPGK